MSEGASEASRPAPVSFEETLRSIFRDVVRAEVRAIVREELAVARPSTAPDTRPDYLTPKAAAEAANVSEKTIRRWVQRRQLRATGIGRVVRIKRVDLDEFMESGGGGKKRSPLSADELALAFLRRQRK